MILRRLHRLLAIGLAAFIVLHLANHLLILGGAELHLTVMKALRPLYRNPIVEPILLVGFLVQISLGLRLVWIRGWPKRFWPRLQSLSGLILSLFLAQHIGATLFTRWSLPELDTNTYWAASVVSRAPLSVYFIPYYILGIAALGIHLSSRMRNRKWARVGACASLACAVLIVAGFAGVFDEIELPSAYHAYLDNHSTP